MSEYYGTIDGRGKTQRTCMGTKSTGLRTIAKTYKTRVIVQYSWDEKLQKTNVEIILSEIDKVKSKTLFSGSEDELISAISQ